MTQLVVLTSSAFLLVAASCVEFARGRVRGQLDFLRTATLIYLMCFAVAPAYLQLVDPRPFRLGGWGWMLKTPFDDPVYAYASLLAVIGYAALLAGYWLTKDLRRSPAADTPLVNCGYLWILGVAIAFLGGAAMLVYVRSIGGWTVFFVEAAAFRGENQPVVSRWAFLTSAAPLVIGAILVFYSLRAYYANGYLRWCATLACACCFVAALALLFHQAGRASLVAFLFTLPLVQVTRKDRLRPLHVLMGGAVFVVAILFGKAFFQIARSPAVFIGAQALDLDAGGVVRALVQEFSFPIVTLAHAIQWVADKIELRWFYDFPLAVVYLVPQRLTGLTHEPTLSILNTEVFGSIGAIPVDLLSLGYYSLLVPGVLITTTVFGALLGFGERLFPSGSDPLRACLRVSWILALGFRVMYADPQLFWRPNLYLVFTTGAVLLPALVRSLVPAPGPEQRAV